MALAHTAPAALVAHCRRAQRSQSIPVTGGRDASDVAGLVNWLCERDEFSDHDTWVNLGMALRLEYGDAGLDLWRLAHDDTVTENVEASKWRSFATGAKPGCVTLNSFMKRAKSLGWTDSIRQSDMFKDAAKFAAAQTLSDDIIAVSLDGEIPPELAERLALTKGAPPPTDPNAEAQEANELAHPTPEGGFIKSSAQFVAAHKPADYVIRPIIQRRFCYAMTAGTGTGKTTIAMRFAAHVAIGKAIDNNVTCKPGTVIYFAGENPDDCRTRWLGLTRDMNLNPDNVDVHFIDGAMHLSKIKERVTAEIAAKCLEPVLIIIDTSMAFFEGEDPNNNREQLEHARRMRSLCALPSGPCVIILCHPVKNAADNNLKPYGGGAFLNEIDGNIFLRKSDKLVAAEADPDKFRGAQFDPIRFELHTVWDHPLIVDSDGMPMPTVIARPISGGEAQRQEERASNDEDKVLQKICDAPGIKNSDVAKAMGGWHHEKTRRALKSLADQGLAASIKDYWNATPKGQKYLNALASAVPVHASPQLVPAVLGGAPFPTPARPVASPPMPPPY